MASPASSSDSLNASGAIRSSGDSDFDTIASSFSTQSTFLNPIYKKTFPSSWSLSGSSVGARSYPGSDGHSQDPRLGTSQKPLNSGYPPSYPVESEYKDDLRGVEPRLHYPQGSPWGYGVQAQDFRKDPYGHSRPVNGREYTNQKSADIRFPYSLEQTVHVPPKPRQTYQYADHAEERTESNRSDGYDVPYRVTNVSSSSSANVPVSGHSVGPITRSSAGHNTSSATQRSAGYDVRYHPPAGGYYTYSTESTNGNSRSAGIMKPIKENVLAAQETRASFPARGDFMTGIEYSAQ